MPANERASGAGEPAAEAPLPPAPGADVSESPTKSPAAGGTGADGAGVADGADSAGVADGADGADVADGVNGADGASRGGAEREGGVGGEAEVAAPQDDPLAAALAERDEYLDALRRIQAEFDNYRKRVVSQQADQASRGVARFVDKLLPVLDTLDLAVQHLGDADSPDGKALVATGSQLHDLLAKEGLERIDPLGEVFDPTAHDAVGHVPPDEESAEEDEDAPPPKPVVAQVLRPGYRWKGTVLRPAMVTVKG